MDGILSEYSLWSLIVTAYLGVGIYIMGFMDMWEAVMMYTRETSYEYISDDSKWKIVLFYIIALSIELLIWPVMLPKWRKENSELKGSLYDKLKKNPIYQRNKQIYEAMSVMCEDGCDTDELPNGYGEFGYEITNPIPAKTILGSTSYLARLRTNDGTKVAYERLGSAESEVSPNPIDIYEIKDSQGKRLAVLYISPYQKKISEKAPKGFILDI